MQKNKWYLTKINSDSFNLSMVALDCAYSIEQLIKNKNQSKYREYLNSGILLLNLLRNAASTQFTHSNINGELLDRTVRELTMSVGLTQISELTMELVCVINDIKLENYNHDNIDFFLKIYDAMNKSSAEILL